MYVDSEGRELNSGDLTRIDRALYRRIIRRFGSWQAFRAQLPSLRAAIEADQCLTNTSDSID